MYVYVMVILRLFDALFPVKYTIDVIYVHLSFNNIYSCVQ